VIRKGDGAARAGASRFLGLAVRTAVLAALGVAAGSQPAAAWSSSGHRLVAELAVASVSGVMPPFVVEGKGRVASASVDPDVVRLRAMPALRASEAPEHYLDAELLAGAALPADRYEFLALLARKGLEPTRVGVLPYAVVEGTERLAVAFAEHRIRTGDEAIREKILYRAGLLAHYAADLCQPLHTTIHFNGRARADGTSPASGIHELVDDLFATAPPGPRLDRVVGVERADDLLEFVWKNFERSHLLVDRVYELESQLRTPEGSAPSVRQLAADRLHHSVEFTAALLVSAWRLSSDLDLPAWRRARLQAAAE
jgi:hypothetical protein